MTDSNKKTESGGSKRTRSRIYGDRKTVSLRLEPDLHRRMTELCDELHIPTNSYVIGLIEADLKKRDQKKGKG